MLSGHRQPSVCHLSPPVLLSRPSSSRLIPAASFPSPKIFTNALLSNHDITSLIRDTEAHERALFSVPPPPPPPTSSSSTAQPSPPASDPQKPSKASSSRRQTVFNVSGGEVTTGPPAARAAHHHPRRNTAVAAVLGGEMHAAITRRAAPSSSRSHSQQQGPAAAAAADVDIEVLLQGAEKLCHVYPLPGALERIPALRQRWASQAGTLEYYEAKVAGQAERLGRMNNKRGEEQVEEDEDEDLNVGIMDSLMTEEDLRREEEEVRELDKKKRELQERLRAMDKDLGALRNM